ncbi:MAG: aminotransferase class I/II-fold pyridoxal phosphate-dependent enzyme, partial [candidate division WOR-3 bacterium]
MKLTKTRRSRDKETTQVDTGVAGRRFATLAIHGEGSKAWRQKAVSCPIFQSATFEFDSTADGAALFAGQGRGYIYTRMGNPTSDALQNTLCQLEHGTQAIAMTSGMAAISTVMLGLLRAGDHALCTSSVYGPTRTLLEKELNRFGIQSTFLDTSDLKALAAALRPETRLVFVETPANPTMRITDIRACARLGHRHDALVCVDNTFATPILQNPLDLGADIVIHSLTKFLNGHSDTVGGAVVVRDAALAQRFQKLLHLLGGSIDPHQAWLILRGIKTLALRVEQAQQNAGEIARLLERHAKVAWVRYPGLASHPQHSLARRQMRGFGSLLCFGLKGGFRAARRMLDSVRLCTLAVSLGGVETLIQHPASM